MAAPTPRHLTIQESSGAIFSLRVQARAARFSCMDSGLARLPSRSPCCVGPHNTVVIIKMQVAARVSSSKRVAGAAGERGAPALRAVAAPATRPSTTAPPWGRRSRLWLRRAPPCAGRRVAAARPLQGEALDQGVRFLADQALSGAQQHPARLAALCPRSRVQGPAARRRGGQEGAHLRLDPAGSGGVQPRVRAGEAISSHPGVRQSAWQRHRARLGRPQRQDEPRQSTTLAGSASTMRQHNEGGCSPVHATRL